MGKKQKRLTSSFLKSKGVPAVLIAGLITASVLGWNGWNTFSKSSNYYKMRSLFPEKTKVLTITDGDTMQIANGLSVRLVGIDAPNRGMAGYEDSVKTLSTLIQDKTVLLEYDTYQDDKYGRILAYVWVVCMQEYGIYCRSEHNNMMLVNEVMVKEKKAEHIIYSKRKRLKYESYFP